MAQTHNPSIRNIALVDHEGAGETTLVEALLAEAGAIPRMGHIQEHNTVSDFDPDEREAEKSYYTTTISFSYRDLEFNLLDVPGSPDCIGEALAALPAVESALVCVDAVDGIKVNTRKMWQVAGQLGLPRFLAVTRLDADKADFWRTLEDIKANFGKRCIPLYLPDGSGRNLSRLFSVLHDATAADAVRSHYEEIVEAIVETDDALMERYLEGGELAEAELMSALHRALLTGSLFPVIPTAAEQGIGAAELLQLLPTLAPAPDEIARTVYRNDEAVPLSQIKGFVGYVYHTAADEFVTRISHVRVLAGSLAAHADFINRRSGRREKAGHIYKLLGSQQQEIGQAVAGDIIAIPRVADMHAGDVITDEATDVRLADIRFPVPMAALAIRPKTRRDEQKISNALHEMENDDRTFHVQAETQTGDLVISGMSEAHLQLMLNKLKRRYKVEVETASPKVPYKETITKAVKNIEYTHKKQSGGAGQYAKVVINLEPLCRGAGYVFEDKIYGGAIDQAFRPAVDKGIQAKMAEGVLAGFPVTDVKVTLIDGKTHPVDSKDIAFQIAGREAFKKAFMQAGPVLLEPIVRMEIQVPTRHIGDVISDLNGKRGKILTSETTGSAATITALVPLAEIQSYHAQLKSMTAGEGSYAFEFDHYEVVPPAIQRRILAACGAQGATA